MVKIIIVRRLEDRAFGTTHERIFDFFEEIVILAGETFATTKQTKKTKELGRSV